ncbi:DMT family transporter [Alistipes putredinis]|uniref:DMT family transporter n=1 Tax=Alistipes putredinis TaxID=28117 RepID=UPI003AF1402F
MSEKSKGTLCGIVAAVSYGMNPLGALSLYRAGVNTNSVLFYRYALAAVLLAALLLVQKTSLRITRRDFSVLGLLGVMFAVSSLTLFMSFHYMDAGIASTLLFVYPVMVAVIMAIFFRERISLVTVLSISLALCGIALLYRGEGGAVLNTAGVVLVMASSLSYALYIVVVNRASLDMSSVKLTFYVLLFGVAAIVLYSLCCPDQPLQLLSTPSMWAWAAMLALIPTVVSLVLMTVAVHAIGSTPTAVMGALEPLTAVVIGVTIFGELFTARLAAGIGLILLAVTLIVAGKSLHPGRLAAIIGHRGFLRHSR